MLESVITVHGIWTEGLWQENVAPVLYPHFQPISVKYPYYRWLGPLDLLFEPFVLITGGTLWLVARAFDGTRHFLAAHSLVLLVVWLFIALLSTSLRLNYAMRRIRKQSAHAMAAGAQPHFIAHSLGSFLLGQALLRIPPMRARRIVLAGCVLKRRFDWESLLTNKGDAFDAIRNEVANKDWVAAAASLLCWRFFDFGAAGRHGFLGSATFVHHVQKHSEPCHSCLAAASPARLHNFVSPHLGHSGVLETSDFASNYWLPFFLGVDPDEFQLFLRLCSAIVVKLPSDFRGGVAGRLADDPFKEIFAALLSRQWRWAGGSRIEAYVREQIEKYYSEYTVDTRRTNDLIKQVIIGVCRVVDDARDALCEKLNETQTGERRAERYDSPARDNRIISLNLHQAVLKALRAAVDQEQPAA